MAGRPGYKTRYEETLIEVEKANTEILRLRNIIASLDPGMLEQDRPTPLKDYNDLVPARVLAMADAGQGEEQWISAFGVSPTTWSGWVQQYPELLDAIEKAELRVLAWWEEQAREAQAKGNNRFPINLHERVTKRLRERIEARQKGEAGLGDASRLVILDLRSTAP